MELEKKMSRRGFSKSVGGMIVTVGGLGAFSTFFSCSNNNPAAPNSPASGSKLEIDLSQHQELSKVGSFKSFSLGSTPIEVFRTGTNSFKALSRVCTHQACTVSWNNSSSKFVCPCHGSLFDKNGGVLRGPAASKLREFTTQYDSQMNKLTITA